MFLDYVVQRLCKQLAQLCSTMQMALIQASCVFYADDFDVQFNKTAKSFRGMDWPAYKFNATARQLFPHAAVIVGYDNFDYIWTILNSCELHIGTGSVCLTCHS
jgi:hypothetical protein